MTHSPSPVEVQSIMQTLSTAARDNDPATYRHALDLALVYELTDEQIVDAYRWGWKSAPHRPTPDFDAWARPIR